MNIARIYLRVSNDAHDLTRQAEIEHSARAAGYYVSDIYREKASGALAGRPELLRMIADLRPGEVVVAEKIDRIVRLPLVEAEQLVNSIQANGARLAVPGIVDLAELAFEVKGVAKIILESGQELLLRLVLQMARDHDEACCDQDGQGVQSAKASGKHTGRKPDDATHQRIVALRRTGHTIQKTAELAGCSASHVKLILAKRSES